MPTKNYIQALRKSNGLTQEQLAAAAGTTPSQLSRMETGTRRINIDILERIAAALGVKVADLIVEKNEAKEGTLPPESGQNSLKDTARRRALTTRQHDLTAPELMLIKIYRDMDEDQQRQWVMIGINLLRDDNARP